MLTLQIVQLRDIKANTYLQPVFVHSVGAYIRELTDQVNSKDKQNPLSMHPGDFEAYHLGTWEDQKSKFELTDPKQLCVLSDLVISVQ